jgi:ATP-dependent helicase HrpB
VLPIEDIFTPLKQHLSSGNVLVVAPPGAGKSTCLPLFLLSLPMFANRKIIMLQPRRIAARNIALYLSAQLGEELGQTVGYRIRGETKTSDVTRLEIVTEGVLTRMLQSSPELPGVGLLIFDEFHERSLHADFSLALSLEVQQALREDLRLLVMSATLDIEALKGFMPNAPILHSEGVRYEVDIQYISDHAKANTRSNIVDRVCKLITDKFDAHQQDWLVFLPGAGEIRRAAAQLHSILPADVIANISIVMLYADLNKDEQQRAIQPDLNNKRKIVLATNIAETSLTIEGIEVVVDSGLEKRALFDLRRGITQLRLQKISQASATQRAGRAGRVMAGTCYRMWPQEQHHRLARQSVPEILQSDISVLLLEAAVWGTSLNELALIDQPIASQKDQAEAKLKRLGVLDENMRVSQTGNQVHKLGGDANIAVMLLRSRSLSAEHQSMACAIAALLESKDPISSCGSSALSLRLQYLEKNQQHPVWQLVRQWHRKLGVAKRPWPLEDTGLVIAFGFVEWIAKHRGEGKFLLANGSGAQILPDDEMMAPIANSISQPDRQWIVICLMQITDKYSDNALVRYAEALPFHLIETHFSELLEESEQVAWDEGKQKISATKQLKFAQITIKKTPQAKPSSEALVDAWRTVFMQKGIAGLPVDKRCEQLIIRAQLYHAYAPDAGFDALSAEALLLRIDDWLLPFVRELTTWQQVKVLPFYQLMSQILTYQQMQSLNNALPEAILIPTGRKANIEYREDGTAALSVRMQEVYGMQQHPRLLNDSLALTFELLSPAQRPLQTTQDLIGFWAGSYKQIQKEMKGRYPRHFWPDDPSNAPATATTKKRMQ